MQRAALLLSLATLAAGCSTDLDINAPYKDITIVQGLLNMRDSVQFIKINKAFLGEGDALMFAQIQDSNEWGPGAITEAVINRRLNGQLMGTFPLQDTLLTNREPGVFYGPEQTLYYFSDNFTRDVLQNGIPTRFYLDENSEYDIKLVVNGETITANTTMVDDFSFSGPDQSTTTELNLINGTGFGQFELNWTSDRDGKRYVAEYVFNYKEVRGTDTTEMKSFTTRIGTDIASSSTSTEPLSVVMGGEDFFLNIVDQVPNDPTVDKRIFLGVDFIVSVANDEFHTYLTLSEPISGIIEDRPTYTNIVNGYGIFASRYVKYILKKRLAPLTLEELADGNLTGPLRFCSGIEEDSNSPYFCP